MRLSARRLFFLIAGAALAPFAFAATAESAELMVHPTRVVLTDRHRTAQVDLVNTGQTQATYRMTLVRKRMTAAGEFEEVAIPEPEEKFADEVVRYSPRQVTLVPGAGQTIRFMFKTSPDLPPGEYRSHLLISKAAAAVSELPREQQQHAAISMSITTKIDVSLPVMARHGNLQASAAIDPASVKITEAEQKKECIQLTIKRSGQRSIYGDLTLFRGKEKVAEALGFAVYTPNTHREMQLPVLSPSRLNPGDTLTIVFTEKDEKNPMAVTSVVLP